MANVMVLKKMNRSIQRLQSQVKNMQKTSPIVTGPSVYDLWHYCLFKRYDERSCSISQKNHEKVSSLKRKKTQEKRRAGQHKGSEKALRQDGVCNSEIKANEMLPQKHAKVTK